MEWHVAFSTDFNSPELLQGAMIAEQNGFDALWLTDIRQLRDCFSLLGAMAARTSSIRLATGVSDPYTRHPLLLAEAALTLDELAPHRIVLGLGAGSAPSLRPMGLQQLAPARTLETSLTSLRTLLAGGTASVDTPVLRLIDAHTTFNPTGSVKLAVVALGPVLYGLAGRLADTVVITNYVDPTGVAWARDAIAKGETQRPPSMDPLLQVLRVELCISSDGSAAQDVLHGRVKQLIESGVYTETFLAPIGLGHIAGTQPTDEQVRAVADATCIAGDPTTVRRKLERLSQVSGIDAISCRLFTQGQQQLPDTVRLFADAIPS